jgi:hypothetical protein
MGLARKLARREIMLQAQERIARVEQFAEGGELVHQDRAVKHQLSLGLRSLDETIAFLLGVQLSQIGRHFSHRRAVKSATKYCKGDARPLWKPHLVVPR